MSLDTRLGIQLLLIAFNAGVMFNACRSDFKFACIGFGISTASLVIAIYGAVRIFKMM